MPSVKQPLDSAKDVANAAGDAISKTASFFTSTIIDIGKGVFSPIATAGNLSKKPAPGTAPGIEHYLEKADATTTTVITTLDYGPDLCETTTHDTIDDALEAARKPNQTVRWINIDGLNPKVVDRVCKHFGVHTLAAEDILNTYQRPKLEVFDHHMLIIARQIQLLQNQLKNEQVSFILMKDTLISFQEELGDVFDPVRRRIENIKGRFRTLKADYLFYALIDCIVDHLFPLLEGYGAAMEELEEEITMRPTTACQQKLFAMKRDLSVQRRILWPLRELIDGLYRDESDLIDDSLKTFYRDVQDHTMQVIDLVESYRDTASGLNDLYQSSVGNKMNEIMKVLTIMASFFIPITFVAGVYGMNFEYIPELQWQYSYFVFWGICLTMTSGLAFYFWRKGWIGKE
ncbi:MAG TPA: magnesium and cobalt transport protein CorA [Opitutae bacterium]|nr:magnesium and cobalt transport protein CorA [Opitutae bacterium]